MHENKVIGRPIMHEIKVIGVLIAREIKVIACGQRIIAHLAFLLQRLMGWFAGGCRGSGATRVFVCTRKRPDLGRLQRITAHLAFLLHWLMGMLAGGCRGSGATQSLSALFSICSTNCGKSSKTTSTIILQFVPS